MKTSAIVGTGSYLPHKILTNHDITKLTNTTDEWIVSRTGITKRHIVSDGEVTSDLATKALIEALSDAKLTPNDLDGLIVATATPELTFPSTAVIVQKKIMMHQGFAFDVSAVCSGFIYALNIADSMLKANNFRRIAVIGADVFSKLLDWNDRSTAVLFGDGAGAVILESQKGSNRGILDIEIYSDGRMSEILRTTEDLTSHTKICMNGKEVFKNALDLMSSSAVHLLRKNHLNTTDIDWILPHQANIRIMQGVAQKLNIPDEKIISTVDIHANTSAASIPLALNKYMRDRRIKENDLILMLAVGAGLTWGGALVRI